MATLKEIENLIAHFSSTYRRAELPQIRGSGLYSLSSDQNKVLNAESHWPETWPNNDERGVYAILSDHEVLYIGKASLQNLGYRLSHYFSYSADRKSAIPKPGHKWSKTPTGIVTWAVPKELFFEASALEEFLISRLKERLPDNTVGTAK
ncbi:hypothetical protein AB4274_13755 [Vibrio sp. 10N.261.55.A10]|uniref:hypothetical protein n=1 Tax=Vibrio sp. 10N.261.55.A10 TaxID=3229687 RepID=UPI0035525B84